MGAQPAPQTRRSKLCHSKHHPVYGDLLPKLKPTNLNSKSILVITILVQRNGDSVRSRGWLQRREVNVCVCFNSHCLSKDPHECAACSQHLFFWTIIMYKASGFPPATGFFKQ